MADCKRKTANLFSDKLVGMTWWNGLITADERFTLYIAEVKPNTTYTASGNNSVDNIMVAYFSVYPEEGQASVDPERYVYPTNPARSIATFTIPDDSRIKYAVVRFGSTATDVMFNLGSIALPYEPHGWVHSLRKLSADTDTLTTLPAVLYPNGTTATVGLKGQAVQSGTPTPDSPIMPEGCGERTENLFNVNRQASNTWTIDDKYYIDGAVGDSKSSIRPDTVDVSISNIGDLTVTARSYYGAGFVVAVTPDTTYTISFTTDMDVPSSKTIATITYVNADEDFLNYITIYGGTTSVTFTTPNTAYYILITFRYASNTITYSDIMLNLGSTPLPYEPYGYKIPISSANTTTPVYLGEVESTRKIGKVNLGTLNWSKGSSGNFIANTAISDCRIISNSMIGNAICTHLSEVSGNNVANTPYSFCSCLNSQARPYINKAGFENLTAEEFKEAMSGVYMYYVLATETTGIVNEPLMKISTYADEVANVSIPVTAGGDTFSVDTTIQPSEVTVNYEGWHPVQNVHEKSRNLFDKSKRTDSSRVLYTTGEIGALSGTFVSDFTPIEPNTTYTLNIVSSISGKTGHLFALYDENKNFVNTGAHEATAAKVYTFTTPSNVAYIRFNGDMSSVDSTMFNEGSTALPYEPYWK